MPGISSKRFIQAYDRDDGVALSEIRPFKLEKLLSVRSVLCVAKYL